MLVAVIHVNKAREILTTVHEAKDRCDAFELRLDYLDTIDLQQLTEIRNKITKPIIFTLRPVSQGGLYSGDEDERLSLIPKLAQLKPDYFDLEHDVKNDILSEFHHNHPDIKIIRSYHNFETTPNNLEAILESMHHPNCTIYKLVTHAATSIDVIRMLQLVKKTSPKIKIAAHCMGNLGVPSRVLGPIVGSQLQYASIDSKASTAPGCLSLTETIETYRYYKLNKNTKIFALLGDPVDQSVGHKFHNQKYNELDLNAVYVKFQLSKTELSAFFKNITGLPFKGFSVTMPLKQEVMKHIHKMDDDGQRIGAINTIHFDQACLSGTNTDGQGALDAIEKSIKASEKKLLILGAGGSATAIAYEAKKRTPHSITILNRTAKIQNAIKSDRLSCGFLLKRQLRCLQPA